MARGRQGRGLDLAARLLQSRCFGPPKVSLGSSRLRPGCCCCLALAASRHCSPHQLLLPRLLVGIFAGRRGRDADARACIVVALSALLSVSANAAMRQLNYSLAAAGTRFARAIVYPAALAADSTTPSLDSFAGQLRY